MELNRFVNCIMTAGGAFQLQSFSDQGWLLSPYLAPLKKLQNFKSVQATTRKLRGFSKKFIYHQRQNELRHFTLKGLYDVFLTSKGENIAFPPPSPPCNVVPLFELPLENNKHPNFKWRGRGEMWILLFFFCFILIAAS